VQEAAQILMDCVADIVDCHGLGPLRSMCNAMQLQLAPSGGTHLDQHGFSLCYCFVPAWLCLYSARRRRGPPSANVLESDGLR
jgi:hypothetical protein